jgi:hypothetical protein
MAAGARDPGQLDQLLLLDHYVEDDITNTMPIRCSTLVSTPTPTIVIKAVASATSAKPAASTCSSASAAQCVDDCSGSSGRLHRVTRASFSFTDGAGASTKPSSDLPAGHAKSDAVEQEVHSAGNTLRKGDLLFPDTTKQIDPADRKELASLGNNDSRVHSADSVFPFSEGAYTQTAALGGGHVRWWPVRRTAEYCSGTPYYLQRASTEHWVSKNSAHKLFGEMPTSNWRSPSCVLEVTVRQELQ